VRLSGLVSLAEADTQLGRESCHAAFSLFALELGSCLPSGFAYRQ